MSPHGKPPRLIPQRRGQLTQPMPHQTAVLQQARDGVCWLARTQQLAHGLVADLGVSNAGVVMPSRCSFLNVVKLVMVVSGVSQVMTFCGSATVLLSRRLRAPRRRTRGVWRGPKHLCSKRSQGPARWQTAASAKRSSGASARQQYRLAATLTT
jgi:hypothetical protein